MELSLGSAGNSGWAGSSQREILGLVFPAFTAVSFSLFVWIFFFLLWRESVSLSVVLIAVNLPLAEVLGLGLFCQQGSE